jgi:hypothetical protein
MDIRLPRLHWEHRLPDWPAAAAAGFAAGAALMVLELLWTSFVTGDNPWQVSHLIAAILMGPGPLQSTGFDALVVGVALVTHYALGIGFGLVLAWIIAGFRFESSPSLMLAAGAVFGLVLYLIDFYAMVRVFPWFESLRGWPTLVAHLVFGIVAALMYWRLDRQGVSAGGTAAERVVS